MTAPASSRIQGPPSEGWFRAHNYLSLLLLWESQGGDAAVLEGEERLGPFPVREEDLDALWYAMNEEGHDWVERILVQWSASAERLKATVKEKRT
jgi:hypothetical protein